ncbi:MAG TPA: DUF542 domain-containing protein, partial [Gemmatimonadaceae bacterium]|nr:DUF542 domain-containing protein [Gemmatimonadaceae bacterium]
QHLTVNEVLLRHPETAAVFNTSGIDSCCGGSVPLESVAQRHGIDLDALLAALENAVPRAGATRQAAS